MKICSFCNLLKEISNFPTFISKKGNIYHRGKCRPCMNQTIKYKYLKKHPERRKETLSKWHRKRKELRPWETHYYAAKQRCENTKHKAYHYYGGRGIKMLLTLKDFQYLWNRDNAKEMSKPSIDKIDTDKNYALDNCQFIEQSENSRKDCVFFGHS